MGAKAAGNADGTKRQISSYASTIAEINADCMILKDVARSTMAALDPSAIVPSELAQKLGIEEKVSIESMSDGAIAALAMIRKHAPSPPPPSAAVSFDRLAAAVYNLGRAVVGDASRVTDRSKSP